MPTGSWSCRCAAICQGTGSSEPGLGCDKNTNKGGLGFLIMNHNSSTLQEESCPLPDSTTTSIEAEALSLALEVIKDNDSTIKHIFTSSKDLQDTITFGYNHQHWRVDPWIR